MGIYFWVSNWAGKTPTFNFLQNIYRELLGSLKSTWLEQPRTSLSWEDKKKKPV